MQNKAKTFGGKCLSKKYKNTDEKLKWQCKEGHIFQSMVGNVVYRNRWCPICGLKKRARSQANSIEDCHLLAKKKGGTCLSKLYTNVGQNLKWKCKNGHTWQAPYRQVNGSKNRQGTWCPTCNSKEPRNLTYARKAALSFGLKCLSQSYVNYNEKMDCARFA